MNNKKSETPCILLPIFFLNITENSEDSEQILNITENSEDSEQILNITENSEQSLNILNIA
jgi:hypothetical protein